MLKNYLILAFRNINKNRLFSFINIFGLAIGLTTCILIFLFTQKETSYDKHYPNADNIYRVELKEVYQGEEYHWAASQGYLLTAIAERYPEVEAAAKIMFHYFEGVYTYDEKMFTEKRVFSVDSTFFDVFGVELIKGDPDHALAGPNSLVLTESTAAKYFGKDDPIGKVLVSGRTEFEITGICPDSPENAHFHYDMLGSLERLRRLRPEMHDRGPAAFHSYLRVKDKAAFEQLLAKVEVDKFEIVGYDNGSEGTSIPDGYGLEILFQPVRDIHLKGHAEKELEANGNEDVVKIFITISIFVLLIACINYMNLATARASNRAKEVGIRKVTGAKREALFIQFMIESALMVFFAILLSLLMAELILPQFNHILGETISLEILNNPQLIMLLIVVFVVVSFFSGFYPAVILSGFSPLKVLKSAKLADKGNKVGLYLRRGLVISQFAISIILIIAALFVRDQLDYLFNKDLGFNKDQVMVLPFPRGEADLLKESLQKETVVKAVSATSGMPGERVIVLGVRIPVLAGTESTENHEDDGSRGIRTICADEDIVKVLGLEVVKGRDFSPENNNDAARGFILNEAAIAEFGLDDPIGLPFQYTYDVPEPKEGEVIGVVKDFHYASFHAEIEPLMIHIFPRYYKNLLVRLDMSAGSDAIKRVEEIWKKQVNNHPFDFFFLDTQYNNQYKSEISLNLVVKYFTILAIFIASLGLFGLSSYIAEQKTKEVAIRKILGASRWSIIVKLSEEFLRLSIIANILAWVPSWLLIKSWLQNFSYKIDLTLYPFLLTAVIAILLTLFTISYSIMKIINTEASECLRYE